LIVVLVVIVIGVLVAFLIFISVRAYTFGWFNVGYIFLQRITEDIAIVEIPSDREFELKVCIKFTVFGEVGKDSFRFLLLFILLFFWFNWVILLFIIILLISLFTYFHLKVLIPILDLVESLFSIFNIKLVNVVQHFDHPIKILFLV